MSKININIESVSGEKSGEMKGSISDISLSTDLKILEMKSKGDVLIAPFTIKIQYEKSIGHINLRGSARVEGAEEELEKIEKKYKEGNNPDETLVRDILKRGLTEASLISKILDMPSPVPLPKSLNKK